MTSTLAPPPDTGHAAPRGRARRLLLGADGDPRWARPALWAVLVTAAALYAWGLSAAGDANAYYSAAVKSGTQSWKAFFFGSLDAGSYITVDKPPMALWAMGLSARVLGFGTWSLLLPQVAAGVAAVAVLYATVRRAFGHAAALTAAAVLALTPITVAINRDTLRSICKLPEGDFSQSSIQSCAQTFHLHSVLTVQPASRYWPFQIWETGIFTALAVALTAFTFWWTRRRIT